MFVHGDLWQGNTLWAGGALVGMVDWDAAGVGHPGIDLGTLCLDAAILFGLPAAAEVLEGWRRAAGQPAEAVAYWDLVAALTTPAEGGQWFGQWPAVVQEHGRGAEADCLAPPCRHVAGQQEGWDRIRQDRL